MENRQDTCDPCVALGKFIGQEVERKTRSMGWAVIAVTGVTIACAVGLKLLDEWLRSLREARH